MKWPYTPDYIGALLAALTGSAFLLTALLLYSRVRGPARVALLGGVWISALALLVSTSMVEYDLKPGPHLLRHLLAFSVTAGTVGALLSRRWGVAIVAGLGQIPLWLVSGYLKDSDGELAALHLAWMGLLVGLLTREPGPAADDASAPAGESSYALHDALLFAAATLLAALVSTYVMDRRDGSADEWGYTYQAAVMAKGRIYADALGCSNYLQNFYVYELSGRMFSQYPPGWSFFIIPFVWVRAIWLSGPFSMGVMAWGIARLSRSAARAFGKGEAPPSPAVVRAAGTWGGVLSMMGTIVLVNGGSRYAHVFVLAMYAWSLEGLMQVTTRELDRRWQLIWGAVLGTAAVLAAAARPADGAFVGLGTALVFLYALARRRVRWRSFAAATVATAFWAGLVLVILRVQLGKWFTTGYSLLAMYHPWGVVSYSAPTAKDWKFAVPLAIGAYCWWPCSMALGLAGLAQLRGRARTLAVAFATGVLPFLVYCSFLEYARADWGYGPRYELVIYVPIAVGSGVALARLMASAAGHSLGGRSALARGGPAAIAAVTVVGTWLHLLPMIWPGVHTFTRQHGALNRAIEKMQLHDAVVLAADGTTGFADMDLTTNLPLDLYPDQDVIIAIDRKKRDEATQCLRGMFPHRRLYYASGYDPKITPAD